MAEESRQASDRAIPLARCDKGCSTRLVNKFSPFEVAETIASASRLNHADIIGGVYRDNLPTMLNVAVPAIRPQK